MKHKHLVGLLLAALLAFSPSAHAQYAGKRLAVFGDSYVRNHKRPYAEAWHALMADTLGMHYTNCGRNGSSIAWDRTKAGFGKNMAARLGEIPADADYVIIIAGHNDASLSHGRRDSLREVRDSIRTFCRQLRQRCPQAQIAWVSPWDVDRTGFRQVNKMTRRACKRNGFRFLNAASKACPIRVRDEEFRRRYFQGASDTAHLNAEGHRLMLPWAMRWFTNK